MADDAYTRLAGLATMTAGEGVGGCGRCWVLRVLRQCLLWEIGYVVDLKLRGSLEDRLHVKYRQNNPHINKILKEVWLKLFSEIHQLSKKSF